MSANTSFFFPIQQAFARTSATFEEHVDTERQIDDTEYDGTVTYGFSAVLSNSSATKTTTVVIREAGQSTDLATLANTGQTPTLIAEAAWTYPASPQPDKVFTIFSKAGGGSTGYIHDAKYIVRQTGAWTKNTFELHPIGCKHTTLNTTYTKPDDDRRQRWLYDNTKFDGTVEVFFEAMISNTVPGSTEAAIADDASTTAVTGSEVTHNTTTLTRKRSGDIKANLTNGEEYELILKATTSGLANLQTASIIVKQSASPTKTQRIIPAGMDHSDDQTSGNGNWEGTGVDANGGQRALINVAGDFSDFTATAFFETAGKDVDANGDIDLIDAGTSDTATTGTTIETNALGASFARTRSSAITLGANGNRYVASRDAGASGTATPTAALVILDFEPAAALPAGTLSLLGVGR